MKLTFFCTLWGCEDLALDEFLSKAKNAGYQGVELGFPLDAVIRDDMVKAIHNSGLEFIGQHYETADSNFLVHKENYRRRIENLVSTKPKFVNSQTGKDFFTFEQNRELINLAHDISKQSGIPIFHETHRGKFSFAAHITESFLKVDPSLILTADFSHWCCVAESLLEDQTETMDLATKRSQHIHARIGDTQRAQVSDPRIPESELVLDAHIQWWKKIVENAKQQGQAEVTITPEFGPTPYMFILPFSQEPVSSQWDINVFMMEEIKRRITL